MATNGDGSSLARAESPTGSPRSASVSLQAAATMNAGLQREPSRRSSTSSLARNPLSPNTSRRRSTVLMNLQLNDPSVPAPGEMAQEHSGYHRSSPQPLSASPLMADPHHHRAPSLGELHQELEAEQEGHVNRLLQMIRQQQLELQRLQTSRPGHSADPAAEDSAIAETVPRPIYGAGGASQSNIPGSQPVGSYSRSPVFPRGSMEMARAEMHRRSRTPSRGASPRLRATSISQESGDWVLGGRDESAFYQAETQMLTRENQMLRHRIRDLEKQLAEFHPGSGTGTEPSIPSHLTQSSTSGEPAGEIIGGGVVGLSIAHRLSQQSPSSSSVLIERHSSLGTETSSRNSEVIHAGIYYGRDTLKTQLCLRGKQLLYEFCEKHGVPHRRTGKWIVAQNDAQRRELEKLHAHCADIGVPVRWVPEREVRDEGEGVRAAGGALESPTTGIVDVHGLMVSLAGLFEDAGGVVALNSTVAGVAPLGARPGSAGWRVDVRDSLTGEASSVTAETVVNAAGLGCVDVYNMVVPAALRKRLYFAKGNYFSYSASRPRVSRLVYPAPNPGAGGLGTHLTLDMGGRIRFGPDIEWVDSPDNLAVGRERLEQAVEEIKLYLPGVDETCLEPDYAGIRPKLSYKGAGQAGKNFNDFVVRMEDGYHGWVNCLGIESPGLTSSLAIGERVGELFYGRK
ncbi:FAD dependent oxidoreductase [Metarhizium guizhouense ARSEF 977]|uniref:L-2-hydroxyglutarate dehydrogenase, mitochondrial n=1 Tax=Metarhizium guizhouense (strain ARSEF 977) TaxID=1276136 RepID=A0A0B4HA23_METGA|nr:FAD dependent oxidoreductase [Metarhizium guizhouense ARSEF 977]